VAGSPTGTGDAGVTADAGGPAVPGARPAAGGGRPGGGAAKAEMRERLQGWRAGLADHWVRAWSLDLERHLLSYPPASSPRTVLVYAALRREPQTSGIAAALALRGAVVALPVVSGPDLIPRCVPQPGEGLDAAAACGPDLHPTEVDLVLVPGLAFDRTGRRLGRGGGHYDRFLPRLRPDCRRIGLCFEGQLVDAVPVEPWDQSVDAVATESGVYAGGAWSGQRG